ncbi:MAG: twin-arginine translocation signal domain-containing protein, partial [Caldimonas sp.]
MKDKAVKNGRRDFLKTGALLGLSAGAPLLMSSCGGGDDAPPPATATRESRHLNFDLSRAPVAEPRLFALSSVHHHAPLLVHTDESRTLHRALNPML